MRIIAIDPGPTKSAFVECEGMTIHDKGIAMNDDLLDGLRFGFEDATRIVIEKIASYGMPVGEDVFETCRWTGRFIEAAMFVGRRVEMVTRGEVKMHLCKSMRAKDSNIRQAIVDLYPATGGGKNPQVGTKRQPGPLFGVSKDIWAALGVALTYQYGEYKCRT